MPTPLTRQDLMAITDGAKNKILDRLITRNDVQGATDTARDRILNTINAFHVETQTLIRQANNQNDQMWRRVAAVESQIGAVRQEVRVLTQSINRLYEAQAQHINRQRAADFSQTQQTI
ncbi:MAG: hypothetical protein ACR2FM_05675 [Candidatus Saccharimonadales bacterium]